MTETAKGHAELVEPLRYCDYCKSWQSKPCGDGCVWRPDMPTFLATPRPEASDAPVIVPVGYASDYGLEQLAKRAHHYCISLNKHVEKEFVNPVYGPDALAALRAELAAVPRERNGWRDELAKVAYFVETHWQGAGLPLEAKWIIKELASSFNEREKELEAAEAEVARLKDENKELVAVKRERDEALSEVEELRSQAETVAEEFEKDCWKAMKSLLAECNFEWRDVEPDGVSAEDAREYISTTLDEMEKGEHRWKARAEAADAEVARLKDENKELVAGLKKLMLAYVGLMENGRDRILFLGGTCDPVDVMERGDPYLAAARSLTATKGG